VRGEDPYERGYEGYSATGIIVFAAEWHTEVEANLRFIARHDPARVLAEVAAKRRVLVRHRPATGEEPGWFVYAGACLGCGREGEFADPRTRDINDCPELRDMASADSDHPDYKERWRVS
jgi:hypothetical protein